MGIEDNNNNNPPLMIAFDDVLKKLKSYWMFRVEDIIDI